MYVPKEYIIHDLQLIIELIRKYSFGTLIVDQEASHIPFNIHIDGNQLILEGHIAISNPLIQSDQKSVLCIFQGPHAYISTQHYERISVPTWDYIAIHCSGTLELLPVEDNFRIVEDLMKQTEYTAYEQWLTAPEKYRNGLNRGIRSFRIQVNKIEAAAKLSQDRSPKEVENLIQYFDKANKELSEWMRYFNTLL